MLLANFDDRLREISKETSGAALAVKNPDNFF